MAIILWITLTVLSVALSIILTVFKLIPKWVVKIVLVVALVFAIRNSAVLIGTYTKLKDYYELSKVKVETIKKDAEEYKEYVEDVQEINKWIQDMKDKVESNAPVFLKDKLEELKEIEL